MHLKMSCLDLNVLSCSQQNEYQQTGNEGGHTRVPHFTTGVSITFQIQLECAASNGNRYPPYPQVMATAISQ